MNIVKIKPFKIEGTTKGTRKYLVKFKVWSCDLELMLNDGSTRVIKGTQFMKPTKLKRDAIIEAEKYKDYILSKGDFYFKIT